MMRFKLIRLEFDRTKYLKEAFWRSFPIIWICEKGRSDLKTSVHGLMDYRQILKRSYMDIIRDMF